GGERGGRGGGGRPVQPGRRAEVPPARLEHVRHPCQFLHRPRREPDSRHPVPDGNRRRDCPGQADRLLGFLSRLPVRWPRQPVGDQGGFEGDDRATGRPGRGDLVRDTQPGREHSALISFGRKGSPRIGGPSAPFHNARDEPGTRGCSAHNNRIDPAANGGRPWGRWARARTAGSGPAAESGGGTRVDRGERGAAVVPVRPRPRHRRPTGQPGRATDRAAAGWAGADRGVGPRGRSGVRRHPRRGDRGEGPGVGGPATARPSPRPPAPAPCPERDPDPARPAPPPPPGERPPAPPPEENDLRPPFVTLALIAANLLWFFVGLIIAVRSGISVRAYLTGDAGEVLHRLGAVTAPDLLAGQWWRLLSACFVHVTWYHILLNLFFFGTVGSLAELVWGRWRLGVIYLLSGLAGSCLAMALRPIDADTGAAIPLAGASGAICGVLAALLAWVLLFWSRLPADVAR